MFPRSHVLKLHLISKLERKIHYSLKLVILSPLATILETKFYQSFL